MLVNICCSGSSGSTLLCQQLNRHPDIACGSELNLFSKLALYERYITVKRFRFLVKRWGVSSNPYSEVRPVFDSLSHYGLTEADAWKWLKECSSFPELARRFEDHILNLTGKTVWAEKTPRNIRVIGHFIESFPEAKIIHLIRDPRDVILSLINRGFDYHRAVEIWLVAVLAIQPYRALENVLEVRYEDLVANKFNVLDKICKFVRVDFKKAFFESDDHRSEGLKEPVTLGSWQADPKAEVSQRSIERYKQSNFDFSQLYAIRPTREYAHLIGVDAQTTTADLMQSYGYSLPTPYNKENPNANAFHSQTAGSLRRGIYNFLLDRRQYMPKILI